MVVLNPVGSSHSDQHNHDDNYNNVDKDDSDNHLDYDDIKG